MRPEMNNFPTVLNVGTKSGCLTIIAGFEAYQHECAVQRIAKFEEEKQKFINGEKSSWHNFDSVETFDRHIEDVKNLKLYKIRCKCGREFFGSKEFFLRKKWRDCGDECGLKNQRETKLIASYPRIKSETYDITFLNTIHDSLEIIECTNDRAEGDPIVYDKRKKGAGQVYLYKEYRCRCYLCGKEYTFRSDQFEIKSDSHGRRAEIGYYCIACCECRENSSSFQWRTVKLLQEYGIPYRVEISFPDLLSDKGNPLRYDFAILNEDESVKYLIECQGKQHYEIGDGYGGYASLQMRQKRDEQKRKYAKENGIQLIEIPYTCNTYEKEQNYLKKLGII